MDQDLLSVRGVADFFGVSLQTIRNWRRRQLLPPPSAVLPNRRALWSEAGLRSYMKSTPPQPLEELPVASHTEAHGAHRGQAA
jgi:hypothetical protein